MTDKTEGIKIEGAEAAEEEKMAAAAEDDAKAGQSPEEDLTAQEPEETESPETEDIETERQEDGAEDPDKKEETEAADSAKYLRLLAEFQNYKRRTEKEKIDLYSYANENIMTELLEVLDNFERALAQEPGEGFKEGMELIFTQLTTVLNKAGLAEITALGEDFDPNVHNAVMAEETDEYESGKVSGVMQKGYTLNGKVIRPSMVKVAN